MTTSSAQPTILIYESVDPVEELRPRFAERGVGVLTLPGSNAVRHSGAKISAADFLAAAADADAVMGLSAADLNREVLQSLPRLKYIVKLGIGYEVIDVEAATELGILVTNTPVEVEIAAVAEHSVALILACMKRLDYYTPTRLRTTWTPDVRAQSLNGSTLGIVGYGRIGQAVAQRLQGWNVRILTYDRAPGTGAWGATAVDLDTLMRQSDVVTVHASAERTGRPLLDRDRLAMLKRGAVVVNTARGTLVDQAHLTGMLERGELSAAGLDVFDPQPPGADDPLLHLPNVFATPHSAAWVPHVSAAIQQMGFDNAIALLGGQHPATIVNPDALSQLRPSTMSLL